MQPATERAFELMVLALIVMNGERISEGRLHAASAKACVSSTWYLLASCHSGGSSVIGSCHTGLVQIHCL